MASIFDNVLNRVEEADRQVFLKYPHLKTEFEQLETRHQELATEHTTTAAALKEWEQWRDSNWDKEAGTTTAAVAAVRERDDKIRQLEASQGVEMTWDEIEAGLTKKGVVTREVLEKEIVPKLGLAAQKDVDEKMNNLSGGMENVFASTAHMPTEHRQEFGERMNMNDYFKFMSTSGPRNDKGLLDWDKGYDSWVGERRAKVAAEAHKNEIEAAEKRGAENALKGRAQGEGGNMPTDQRGSSGEMGHLQARKLAAALPKDEKNEKLPEGALGSGVPAQQAYDKWQQGQRATQVQ